MSVTASNAAGAAAEPVSESQPTVRALEIADFHIGTFDFELQVNEDCEAGNWIVAFAKIKDGVILPRFRSAFWLPDFKVKSGDVISLYQDAGDNTFGIWDDDGVTHHHWFMNLRGRSWDPDKTGIFLFETGLVETAVFNDDLVLLKRQKWAYSGERLFS